LGILEDVIWSWLVVVRELLVCLEIEDCDTRVLSSSWRAKTEERVVGRGVQLRYNVVESWRTEVCYAVVQI
jgi:hypothetical protein